MNPRINPIPTIGAIFLFLGACGAEPAKTANPSNAVSNETAPPQDGKPGKDGAQGTKGDKGDTGPTGAKGDKGDRGDSGAAGASGVAGVAGPTGAVGAMGNTGPAGPSGPSGATGATGADGAAAIVDWTDPITGRLWITQGYRQGQSVLCGLNFRRPTFAEMQAAITDGIAAMRGPKTAWVLDTNQILDIATNTQITYVSQQYIYGSYCVAP